MIRKAVLLTLLGVLLSWSGARASGDAPAAADGVKTAADAAFVSSLSLSPLEGAVPLLPPSCPVLCNLKHGKSCSGTPATEPCYDSSQQRCSTCTCSANHTWSCLPV